MKKAIVIGASTGIGREVAIKLSDNGYAVGLVSRRIEILRQVQEELSGPSEIAAIDITNAVAVRNGLQSLIQKMGEVDLIIINAGIGIPDADWKDEQKIVQTNVNGFVAVANFAFEYFKSVGKGNLAGVSSVAGLRGGRRATAYCASKAFVSSYLEGLRYRAMKENPEIKVTDIIPGFVETPMTHKLNYTFWVATAKTVARQMITAIERGKAKAYVTSRWRLVASLMKIIPDWIYCQI